MDPKVNLTVDGNEIIFRTGDAPVLKEPQRINISGDINAPASFVEKRKTEIKKLEAHVLVNREKFNIQLILDEKSHYSGIVIGTLELFSELAKLKINEEKTYSPHELYRALKFFGVYFKNREQHEALCAKLTKFTSRIETDFTNSNDWKGNIAHQKLTKIHTDLDLTFTLSSPIFKGGENVTFEVDICLDAKDGGVICWLESVDLHEQKSKTAEDALDKAIESLSDYVIINV